MPLCFATNNAHKITEINQLLSNTVPVVGLADIGCYEELPETQLTIEGNARQKARYVWEYFQVACFADDTGLEVGALDGAPGVYSARYAGPQRNTADNIHLLLQNLQPPANRQAQFRTCIVLILNGQEWLFEGTVTGHITDVPRGTNGFGYDPVFVPDGQTRTFAEMEATEKNRISHRARAVQKLVDFLRAHPELTQPK